MSECKQIHSEDRKKKGTKDNKLHYTWSRPPAALFSEQIFSKSLLCCNIHTVKLLPTTIIIVFVVVILLLYDMEAVDRILFNGKRLGYEHLKEEQFEVVTQYVQGRDCFFRAPTGYGKSVVFQLAPFVCASPTTKTVAIIIVPTIALAQDAVGKTNDLMAKHDIPLTAVHLTCASLSLAREASYIFTSPEAILDSHIGRQLLNSAEFCSEVKAIFVDEGHIVESWGYSEYGRAFRAQYGQLGVLRSFFPACPVIAITATAVSATRTFVIDSLGMRRIHDVSVDINKVNIKYNVVHCMTDEEENFDWLIEELKQHSSSTPRTLVFFTRANKLYSVYNHIKQHTDEPNPLLAMYHKLTDGNIRQDVISSLNESDSRLRVVLCTSSLSVGVNLSCVEYVVHYGVPVSVQDFLQETGRAAREPGSVGQSILMTYPRQTKPGTDQSLKDYSSSKCAECRRAIVLKPFNVVPHRQDQCCDVCDSDITDHFMQSILSNIQKLKKQPVYASDSSASSTESISNVNV